MTTSSAWEKWGVKKNASHLPETVNYSNSTQQSSTIPTFNDTGNYLNSIRSNVSQQFTVLWTSAQKMTTDYTQVNTTVPKEKDDSIETIHTTTIHEETQVPLFWQRISGSKTTTNTWSMSWNTRLKYCVTLALLSAVFLSLAGAFIPLVILRPSKFALSFTLGSICFMGAVIMLIGPMTYITRLSKQPTQIFLSAIYIISLLSTLYSCLILGNYILVVTSAIFQLCTLAIIGLGALPKGRASLTAFLTLITKMTRTIVNSFQRLFM